MVINLAIWRRIHAEEQLLKMIAKAPERFRWWDQTAMNALFTNQVTFLEPAWNTSFADLVARSLNGVRLASSDAHPGLVEAISANLPGQAG